MTAQDAISVLNDIRIFFHSPEIDAALTMGMDALKGCGECKCRLDLEAIARSFDDDLK